MHENIIDLAFQNGDKDTVIEAYLDILDYKTEITKPQTFEKVLECMNFVEVTDNVLLGHIKD